MGKGKGATVSVQNLGWEDLAEAAEKAGKPSVVVDLSSATTSSTRRRRCCSKRRTSTKSRRSASTS